MKMLDVKCWMLNITVVILALVIGGLSFCTKVYAITPTEAVKDLDRKTSDYKTGKNLSKADLEHNRKLKKELLTGTFDVEELSKIALGTHWSERSSKEQKDFVQLMTDLLEHAGVLSKEQGKKKTKNKQLYKISYLGDKYLNEAKTRCLTRTSVYVISEDIKVGLNYKLKKTGDEWKIYDVIADGASLVDNYKYQFNSIIKEHGYDDLVNRMKRKLERLQQKEEET